MPMPRRAASRTADPPLRFADEQGAENANPLIILQYFACSLISTERNARHKHPHRTILLKYFPPSAAQIGLAFGALRRSIPASEVGRRVRSQSSSRPTYCLALPPATLLLEAGTVDTNSRPGK